MKKLLSLLIVNCFVLMSFAGEGMWIPLLLKALNEQEMQSMGMKMTAEDIYSVNQGSLKDAIVHFGGFCTGEIISQDGLVLTNHHCGYSQIQYHSSLEKNFLKDGFWAQNRNEELPNPGLFVKFIVRIEDVSEKILAGIDTASSEEDRQSIIDKNINALRSDYTLNEFEEIEIRPFYKGNQYFLFVTESYQDVRLVGTPPESIGKFGADTDNWVWPRHTGDFSLFRVYADKDNNPAEYSPDNIPLKPKHFLPISLDGVDEDDFTLVFGFPGRTNEYLPSYAVEQIVDVVNPARISMRDRALAIMGKYMRESEEMRLKYSSKFARIANAWKKWIGENLGIKKTKGIERKQKYETDFNSKINSNKSLANSYGGILKNFKGLYQELEPYAEKQAYYSELNRSVDILRLSSILNRLIGRYKNNGEKSYIGYKERISGFIENYYKNYEPNIDRDVFAGLLDIFMENIPTDDLPGAFIIKADWNQSAERMASYIFGGSNLTEKAKLNEILSLPPEDAIKAIESDPAFQIYKALDDKLNESINPEYNRIQDQIDRLMRDYMKAQMEAFPDKRFYPDANSTMRVTYGNVKSYSPADAVVYSPITFLEGVMEKYKPGDYEFDVDSKLIELFENKDYGDYAMNGKMPVCFIGTNHTTGGNSGSPAIDAYGNLVGLNFDRAWEGTMSDYNYDPSICRNIMVDARYILFIIDKYAGADHLVKEMKLVRPKS